MLGSTFSYQKSFICSKFTTGYKSYRFLSSLYVTPKTESTDKARHENAESLPTNLIIEKDEKAVGIKLCDILQEEYRKAVTIKGTFCFGISGGSMLKMLENLDQCESIDFKKCTMIFVSHRCLSLDDDGSTFHKA